MTTDDARELYLTSDCSYFIMCTYYYSGYMQYRQFDPPKTLESLWKNEKLRMLQKEMQVLRKLAKLCFTGNTKS